MNAVFNQFSHVDAAKIRFNLIDVTTGRITIILQINDYSHGIMTHTISEIS